MAKCEVSDKCGGCSYIGRPYEYQLGLKQDLVNRLIGKFCPVDNIIACDEPYYYRNKVHSAFKRVRGGKVIHGTYEPGSHRITAHRKCLIENKKAQEIINSIEKIAVGHKVPIYDERTCKGLLRRVLVRISEETGQIMVVIVAGNRYFKGKREFTDELLKMHPEITSVVFNYNERTDSMILGSRSRVEYGTGSIEEVILEKRFRVSPDSFLQVNTKQTNKLYSAALSLAGLGKEDTVLDCYCGIGTITICAAGLCSRATGVEINPRAISDAKANARLNKCRNTDFIAADATVFMEDLAKHREANSYDVIIMDPPRSGSTHKFIKAAAKLDPSRIVYISCNPETLARDLKVFVSYGYKAVKAVPVDMFPWTDDVETCCLLTRKDEGKRSYVSLDVEIDDHYRIKNETEVPADAT